MDKRIRKWLREVDLKENEIIKEFLKSNKRMAVEIGHHVNGAHYVLMNLERKKRLASAIVLVRQWYGENSKIYKKFMKGIYGIGWKQAGESLNLSATFSTIPDISPLIDGGLIFMKNYTVDMEILIKKRLALGMLDGQTYAEVAKDLEALIPANAHRRIPVMVRDQSSRIYQESIEKRYLKEKKLIKEFRWEGPLDKRTTPICRARQEGNPYTLEQMERMDPHPHIQCRHRWVAVPKE